MGALSIYIYMDINIYVYINYVYYDYIFKYIYTYGYLIWCVVHVHIYIYININIYIYGFMSNTTANQRHCLWEIPRHCRDVNPSGEGSLRRWKDKVHPGRLTAGTWGYNSGRGHLPNHHFQVLCSSSGVYAGKDMVFVVKNDPKRMPTITTWPRSLKI